MKTKEIYLQDIRQGDKIASTFLVAEKSMAFSQKGSAYLNVRLKDKTGEMDGKVWDHAAEMDQIFKKGDIIDIEGRVQSYRNALQISIVNIKLCAPENINPSDYLPVSKLDTHSMFRDLIAFIDTLSSEPLKKLLAAFVHDEKTADLFGRAPAAKGFHHIYLGGLLEHTLSVVRLLDKTADHYPQLNRDLLIAGGMLHDIGKTVMFNLAGDYMLTAEARNELINEHHTEIGQLLAQKWNFSEDIQEVILYHHTPESAQQHRNIVDIIFLANLMAHSSGEAGSRPTATPYTRCRFLPPFIRR